MCSMSQRGFYSVSPNRFISIKNEIVNVSIKSTFYILSYPFLYIRYCLLRMADSYVMQQVLIIFTYSILFINNVTKLMNTKIRFNGILQLIRNLIP